MIPLVRLPLCVWCCSALVNSAQVPRAATSPVLDADDVPDNIVMKLFGPPGEVEVDAEAAIAEDGTQLEPVPFRCGSDYLLVFSLPKTGTTSFDYSMKNLCGLGREHYVPVKQDNYPQNIKVHDTNLDVALDFMRAVPPGRTVFVVSLTRNPWERAISSFFQLNGAKLNSFEEARDMFNDGYVENAPQREQDFWQLLANVSGAEASDLLRNWQFHVSSNDGHLARVSQWKDNRRVHVVVLREEDIFVWPGILQGKVFPGFKLVTGNVGSEKDYAELYSIFKDRYHFTDTLIEAFAKSPALNLYTPSEVAEMVLAARND